MAKLELAVFPKSDDRGTSIPPPSFPSSRKDGPWCGLDGFLADDQLDGFQLPLVAGLETFEREPVEPDAVGPGDVWKLGPLLLGSF